MQRRRFRLLLAYALATLPIVGWGAWHALAMNANSPLEWVPESSPDRRDYEEFRRVFGNGDIVVASWAGCTVDDPRLQKLTTSLRQAKAFLNEEGHSQFERVISGAEVFQQLVSPPVSLSREEAQRRLRGSLIGSDGETTCLVVTFSPAALSERAKLVRMIRLAAKKQCHIAEEDLHLAGPVMDGLEVDTAGKASLDKFAAPSAIIVCLLCCVFLRTIRGAAVVFLLSLYCEAATLAVVHFCGDTMSALLIVLPPLIQASAVSGGIHLVNYYYEAARSHGVKQAVQRAFSLAWLPCALSAGTTAIGLASLMVSDLVPIRAFGAYGGVGMLLTTGLLLAVIPATFALWPPKELSEEQRNPSDTASEATEPSWSSWSLLSRFLNRFHQPVAITAIAAMIGLGIGAWQLNTSVRIETLFRPDNRLMQDYAWMEANVGPLVPIEVVLRCDPDCRLSFLDRVTLVSHVQQALVQHDAVGGAMSAVTFAPRFRSPPGVPQEVFRESVDRALSEGRQQFIDLKQLHESSDGQLWRITARVSALSKIDYGEFLDIVRKQVEPLLQSDDGRPIPGLSARYTGIMPVVHDIQRRLFHDLFSSFLSAFVVITLVMIIVQGGVIAGLLSMVSNLFPIVILFGWLGWQKLPMDIGSVMTASVALGIAIDNTLHLLTFFRREVDEGQTPFAALDRAYRHCGNAMVQSTLICLAGTSVFALSEFVPTFRFAWMMVILLLLALLGDLVVLPALLLGPLGRFFKAPATEPEPPQSSGPDQTPAARRGVPPVSFADVA